MNSQQQPERRTLRYPLQLPVSVRLGGREIHAKSENISLGGILLSSEFLIPEGSAVEIAVGVAHLPDHAMTLTAKGRVCRLAPTPSGGFAVAIECDHSFELRYPRS
ncbi:MAG TPA: PilZ domain-containing protein [Dongiaceae bacterium]|nr:PilZ domain-containing protein [Dongiaceae bacterium]